MSARGGIAGAVANAAGFAALTGVLFAAAAVVPYGGLGLIALSPLVGRGHVPPGPRFGPVARPLAALLGAPALLVMPALMTPERVVVGPSACDTATATVIVLLPVAAFFTGVLAAAMGLGIAAAMPRLLARLAAPLKMAALAVVAVLLVAGAARWVRQPTAEGWVDRLPVAATVLPALTDGAGTNLDCETTVARLELPQGSRTVLLRCGRGGRRMVLGDAAEQPLAPALGGLQVGGESVAIRPHAGLGVVVLTQAGRTVGAFDASDGRLTAVRLRSIASEVAPPGLALLAAAAALAVAIQRGRRASRERAAAATMLRAEPATVDESGVVCPSDGGDAFRPPGASLPAGPALILVRPHAAPFRGGADRGTWVLSGTQEEHVVAHRARAAIFDLEATAAVFLGAAPLITAAVLGLVL